MRYFRLLPNSAMFFNYMVMKAIEFTTIARKNNTNIYLNSLNVCKSQKLEKRTFYHLFYHLEDCGVLDVNNELHMFSLHYVFVPRLNKQLADFVEGWLSHGLSSANNDP